jgi:type IV pilus assembly protein PilN
MNMLPKINFLPYREMFVENQKQQFKQLSIAVAIGAACLVFAWGYVLDSMNADQQQRNQFLQTEIQKMDIQLTEVNTLREEIKALTLQRDTVYKLQNNRAFAVEWLEMLVRKTPRDMYLSKISHKQANYELKGVALDNERISQYMSQLEQVQWLDKLKLIESRAKVIEDTNSLTNENTKRTLFEFVISFERTDTPELKASTNIQTITQVNNLGVVTQKQVLASSPDAATNTNTNTPASNNAPAPASSVTQP